MAGFRVTSRGLAESAPQATALSRAHFLNVLNLGATGNNTGVGDDAAFQAALAQQFAFREATGGLLPIYVPPGRYLLSTSMQMYDGFTLIGESRDWFGRRTIVQNIHNTMFTYPGANVTDVLLEKIAFWGDGAKTLNCFDPQDPSVGIIMSYGRISGCAFQSFARALQIRGTGCLFEDLNIGNTANTAVAISGFDSELSRLFIGSNLGTLPQMTVTNCLTTKVRDCFITAPQSGPILVVDGGEGCEFIGNYYDGFNAGTFTIAGSAIQFKNSAQGHRILGGRIHGAVQSPSGFDQGAILFNTASDISVMGVEFNQIGPTGTAPTLAFNGTNDQIRVLGSTYINATPSITASATSARPTNLLWDEQIQKNAVAQLPGMIIPQDPQTGPATVALGNTARYVRVCPPRDIKLIKIAIQLSTAGIAGDSIDVGVYDSGLNWLASNGGTTGLIAATGVVTVPVTWTLLAGQVYYVAVSATSGTTAQALGATYQNVVSQGLFGTAAPNLLFGTKGTAFPLPTGSLTNDAASGSVILMALREA